MLFARLHPLTGTFAPATWRKTLPLTTDAGGTLAFWVKSSDVICTPHLLVLYHPSPDPNKPSLTIANIPCDFAASVTFRNFANPVDPDDTDDFGWIFDFPKLTDPTGAQGDIHFTPAKVYLKFKIDPSKPDDYVDDDGHGNWQFVNGHQLVLKVAGVEITDPDTGQVQEIEGTPEELKQYAFVVSSSSGPVDANEVTATRTTTAKGETAPQVYVFAGDGIDKVVTIYVVAEEQTECLT